MTQKRKQLLIKDLCTRLPYHVIVKYKGANVDLTQYAHSVELEKCKPYLRSMSSMTEEERDEIEEISHGWFWINEDGEIFPCGQFTDSAEFEDAILPTFEYFLKKHIDYLGLIPRDLAFEAPKNMYNV